jgi:coenzyme F420-reducing hydrogenase gamma subunit
MKKPRIAVWKFSSCDGCQLSVLDCEDELLALAERVEIAYFLEATSTQLKGPYTVSLVEGSISTPDEVRRITEVRKQSKTVITIGACATAGGIQALRNFADVEDYKRLVYARPDYIESLREARPIADFIPVDFELRGCPVNKHQLLEVLNAFLNGRKPNIGRHSLCVDCKRQGLVCVMVAHGTPCLGPITQSGCGVLCPKYHRGCYGCFGPSPEANCRSLGDRWLQMGVGQSTLVRTLRTFNAFAPPFKETSHHYEEAND